jgi:hypothetical protein
MPPVGLACLASVRSGPGHDFFDDRLDFGAIDLWVDLLRETIHRPPKLFQPATVLEDDLLHEHDLVLDLIQAAIDPIQAAIDPIQAAIDLIQAAIDLIQPAIDLLKAAVDLLEAAVDLLEAAIDVFTKALQCLAEDLELRPEILNQH